MTYVEKSEILYIWHVFDEKMLPHFAWSQNLFCRNLHTLCGEKLSQKFSMWRKNDKFEVCFLVLSWLLITQICREGHKSHI